MPPIEGLRVHAVDLAHPSRKRRFQRFNQEMIVIAHQAPGPDAPIKPPTHTTQVVYEYLAVFVVNEDIGPSIATRHDVIQRAFESDAKRSGHMGSLSLRATRCKSQDLTPFPLLAVFVVNEDIGPSIATRHDVIQRAV